MDLHLTEQQGPWSPILQAHMWRQNGKLAEWGAGDPHTHEFPTYGISCG